MKELIIVVNLFVLISVIVLMFICYNIVMKDIKEQIKKVDKLIKYYESKGVNRD